MNGLSPINDDDDNNNLANFEPPANPELTKQPVQITENFDNDDDDDMVTQETFDAINTKKIMKKKMICTEIIFLIIHNQVIINTYIPQKTI